MNVPQGMAYRARHLAGSHRFHLLCIYIVVFLIHFSVSLQVRWLSHSTDEFGVVSITSYLTGEDWTQLSSRIPYYGYIQAVFYLPAFLVTKNPELRYLLMGVINSLALSTIPLMIYDVLHSFQFLTHRYKLLYSFVVGIYPSFTIYTKWVWNETAMCVLPWVVVMLLVRLADEHGSRWIQSALLGFVSIVCYAAHGRGILFPFISVVLICYFILFHHRLIVRPVFFLLPLITFYFADKKLKHYFQAHVWLLMPGRKINNTMEAFASSVPYIRIQSLLRSLAGKSMAALFASYGLILVLILFCLNILWVRIRKKTALFGNHELTLGMELFGLFSLLSFTGSLLISALASSGRVGDFLIYTRYNANTMGFTVLYTLLILYETKQSWKLLLASAGLYSIWLPLFFTILPNVGFGRPNMYLSLIAYMPKGVYYNKTSLFFCGFITWSIFFLILILSRIKSKLISAIFLSSLFLYTFYYDSYSFIIPNTDWYGDCVRNAAEELSVFQELEQTDELSVYYYNPTRTKDWAYATMQFLLPELTVIRHVPLNSPRRTDDLNSLIYSGGDHHLDYKNKNYYRIIETRAIEGLRVIDENFAWIYGEELRDLYVEATGKTAENHYGETKTTNLPLSMFFTTKAGVKDENNYITSTGTSGTLLYGPYIYLEKGRYQITIRGELLSGELDRSSSFDIRSNITKITHLTLPDLSQFVHGNSLEINVPLTTNVDITAGEFRISVNSGVKLKITSVNLRYFGSLMPGDPGFIYDFGEPDSFDYFGFSEQEDSFRRIDAKLAAVSLGWLPGKQDCDCRIELAEPLPEEWFADSQYALSVSVNDRPEIPLTLRPGDTSVSFPLRRTDLEENNILTFRSDLRPLGTGDSDTEKYGIPIQKIVVKSEEE